MKRKKRDLAVEASIVFRVAGQMPESKLAYFLENMKAHDRELFDFIFQRIHAEPLPKGRFAKYATTRVEEANCGSDIEQ